MYIFLHTLVTVVTVNLYRGVLHGTDTPDFNMEQLRTCSAAFQSTLQREIHFAFLTDVRQLRVRVSGNTHMIQTGPVRGVRAQA